MKPGLLALWALALSAALDAAPGARAAESVFDVTPVEGQSWLKRLDLRRERSVMGQMGDSGVRQPPAVYGVWGQSSIPETLGKPFTLTGADLYRLDCQACHNVGGVGSPPEIRSLIDPVRATSRELVRAEMAKRGLKLDEGALKQMNSQAEAALRERLRKGGDKMPPFPHLQGVEVDALLAYLRNLAGVPGAADRQIRVAEPAVRVGEHLIKGTCFICHDATGPGSDAMEKTPGLIPSLMSFLEQKSVAAVVHKVREGAPAPGLLGSRGEMPVFSYLTAEEVTAGYLYLSAYPPKR